MSVSFLTSIGRRSLPLVSICSGGGFSHRSARRGRLKEVKGWPLTPEKLRSWCVADGNGSVVGRVDGGMEVGEESDECVEVILVGSRRDSLIDFCSASPFLSSILRFWFVSGDDSGQVRLEERLTRKGSSSKNTENISLWQPSCKAVILVVSAAYGPDQVASLEVLSRVKSKNGLVVGLILKPFSFEGKRRQAEVNALSHKIRKLANFCIVLDTDTLLENDLVTLDEAWRTSNNAALMVMNAISILFSDKQKKLLNMTDNITRDLQLSELPEVLKGYREVRVAFGAGYNVQDSLLHAMNGCAFLRMDMKEPGCLIFCTIEISALEDSIDMNNVIQSVRSTINCEGKVILSIVIDPNLESCTIRTTIISFGFTKESVAPKNGTLFSFRQYFPFIFDIFKNLSGQNSDSEEVVPHIVNSRANLDLDMSNANSFNAATGDANSSLNNFLSLESRDEVNNEEMEGVSTDTYSNFSTFELDSEGFAMPKGEQLARGTFGQGYTTESSKFTSSFSEANASDGTVSIYQQPVGVKASMNFEETPVASKRKYGAFHGVNDNEKRERGGPSLSPSESPGYFQEFASLEKDIHAKSLKKQGGLSVRAASMLESERDTSKKWSRAVEMKYRGGIYVGHVQGGLPEGKGRLLLTDGSIYDGTWRCGKRSGMGTFYFNNGDVYKGLWRNDAMHGKGWVYFHSGDRWFVNFWKGKPNGEGRFYSRLGDIFFGSFKEGWRHGHFLRIDVDGTRYQQAWDEGVLVSEKQLDSDG